MPFLSCEQRKRAIAQHQKVIDLLQDDQSALVLKLAQIHELIRCNRFAIERISKAEKGEFDIDRLQECDDMTRDTMMRGIHHYPVVISGGIDNIIRA